MNTAAIGVSHHDDVMHLKMLDAVFDGRDHRVVFARGVLVRNNGSNAADHEQVAGLASQNDAGSVLESQQAMTSVLGL